MTPTTEIILYAIITLIATLGYFFLNFTKVADGRLKYVNIGETFSWFLSTKTNWHILGYYWIGIRHIHYLKKIKPKKEKENPDGKKPEEWTVKGQEVEMDYLLEVIQRPFVITDVELQDRTKVDLLVTVVLNAHASEGSYPGKKFVYELNYDFLKVGSKIRTLVQNQCRNVPDLTAFIALDKTEETGFLSAFTKPDSGFNKNLIDYADLIMVSIEIPQFQADSAMIEAANKKAIATLEAEAIKILAEANALKIETEGKAVAAQKEREAKADIEGIMSQLNQTGASDEAKLVTLQQIIKYRSVEKSTLTAFAEGGASSLLNM